jgi:hypothetical protein
MAYQIFPIDTADHAKQWSLSGPLYNKAVEAAASYNWEPYTPEHIDEKYKNCSYFKCKETGIVGMRMSEDTKIMLTGRLFNCVLMLTKDEQIIKEIIE